MTDIQSTWGILREKLNSGIRVNLTERHPPFFKSIREYEDWFTDASVAKSIQTYFDQNWHWSVYIAIFYLAAIIWGKKYMAEREAKDLRVPLILWSALLATFSICGAYRHIIGFLVLYQDHGLRGTLCGTYYYHSNPEGFWVLMFVLSKVPELFDTFFIIARKKKLIFLHWYHHTTVMMYSFYLYRDKLAGGAYYGAMNFSVHAVMYTYYTFTALKIRLPKFVSKIVTTMQIMQMFVGVGVTAFLWFQLDNPDCPIHFNNVMSASLMYSTYLVLFVQFFWKAYMGKSKKKIE